MNGLTWIGIAICIVHSAMFSGLNLAALGVTRLRLEIEASVGNKDARQVLKLRQDTNFLLTTILWGNVAFNTLLAILSSSVMTGVAAFLFSTVLITFVGEILPQAYFSRKALRMASLFSPVIRFYQIVLYPVAKPSAKILDWWLGEEGITYFREGHLREMLKVHIEADETDLDRLEGIGALNFMALDDLLVLHEGESINPLSIISLQTEDGVPVCPDFERNPTDPFIQRIQASGEKWVIATDQEGTPAMVIDADGFLRGALFSAEDFNPYAYCYRPIIVTDTTTLLGEVLSKLHVEAETTDDDVIDQDIILVWSGEKRIITGADILGRLLRGIVIRKPEK